MPIVEVSLPVAAPPGVVWAAVTDIERYPDCMQNVRSVSIVSDPPQGPRLSSWSVFLKGSVLEWIESDVLDHERRRATFTQTSGDLQEFSGFWQVDEVDQNNSRITLYVSFDIGIPMLADMLNPVAATALEDNAHEMLNAIEGRVTGVAHPVG